MLDLVNLVPRAMLIEGPMHKYQRLEEETMQSIEMSGNRFQSVNAHNEMRRSTLYCLKSCYPFIRNIQIQDVNIVQPGHY